MLVWSIDIHKHWRITPCAMVSYVIYKDRIAAQTFTEQSSQAAVPHLVSTLPCRVER